MILLFQPLTLIHVNFPDKQIGRKNNLKQIQGYRLDT